jgi:hypothetical protein
MLDTVVDLWRWPERVMMEHRLRRMAAEGNYFEPGALKHTQGGRSYRS